MAKKQPNKKNPSQVRKLAESLAILSAIGVPLDSMTERRRVRVALALLTTANIKPDTPWIEAVCWEGDGSWSPTTREIIKFWNRHYGENLSRGSYDNVWRMDLIYLVESRLVLRGGANPHVGMNARQRSYAVNPDWIDVLRTFGQPDAWQRAVNAFREAVGSLHDRMERRRQQRKVPVKFSSGESLELSFGPHNDLQKAIIEEFLPRYTRGAEILYIGDTAKKSLLMEEAKLKTLGFFELAHGALPDVIAYDAARNWLFLIEAVHSSNPISKLRHLMLERMTEKCTAPRIYVSVFRDRKSLRNWLLEISWETEVWLVESPDHVLHFDGEKYLGPYVPDVVPQN